MTTRAAIDPQLFAGETVHILGNGPGMSREFAASLQGRLIAVNRAIQYAPDADLFVALDPEHHSQVNGSFRGVKVCGVECDVDALYAGMYYERVDLAPGHQIEIRNNLLAAMRIAAAGGAKRVVLHGCDTERYEQIHNFPGLTAGVAKVARELRAQGIEVYGGPRTPLILHAMSGLGDNLHARALLPDLCAVHEIWINTRWPQVFHDYPQVHVTGLPPLGAQVMTLGYHPRDVWRTGSVVGAMAKTANVTPRNFELPVPRAWREKARAAIGAPPGRPLCVFRPVIAIAERSDDSAKAKLARNPNLECYTALFLAIRRRFFVVSIADCRDGREWLLERQDVGADCMLHYGELDFEAMCGLFAEAALVYCHPGFAVVLAQAVGTPSICVFGGYEDAQSFAAGASYAPWLPLEPITPCACWDADCAGNKSLNMADAAARIDAFVAALPDA